jgi:hypothetical protein
VEISETRTEEIKEALEKLKEQEVDRDLLLAQEITVITGENRVQHKSSIFFDKGSTCSMITKHLVEKLGLESLQKTIIVKSFMHTEAIGTEFVVIELLRENGTVALVRAYVVDSNTEMTQVKVPEEIRGEFSVQQIGQQTNTMGKLRSCWESKSWLYSRNTWKSEATWGSSSHPSRPQRYWEEDTRTSSQHRWNYHRPA